MRVIIAGSRHLTNVQDVIDFYLQNSLDKIECIVCGMAAEGMQWGLRNGYPIKEFHADWKTHGKAAGPKRNAEMAKFGTHLLLIWDGKSRGSANMLQNAELRNLIIRQKIIRSTE